MPKLTARRRWLLPLVALTFAAAPAVAQHGIGGGRSTPPTAQAQQPPPQALPQQMVFKRVTLTDPGMGNMPSHTILVPQGWRAEGGAWWPPQQFSGHMPSQEVKLVSPEGVEVVIGPEMSLIDYRPRQGAMQQRPPNGSVSERGLPNLHMPNTLDEWKTFYAQASETAQRPGVTNFQVVDCIEIPGPTAELRRSAQQSLAQTTPDANDGSITGSADGRALLVTATYQLNGRAMEEASVFATTYLANHFNFMATDKYYWTVTHHITFRGPSDAPDATLQLAALSAQSLRPTLQWARMRAEHMAKINRMNIDTQEAIAAINAETQRYVSDLRQRSYDSRMASNERLNDKTINALTDREDYVVPGTNDYVNLPSGYDHAHYGDDGTIILTNDINYDPNADANLNGSFQPMKVRP